MIRKTFVFRLYPTPTQADGMEWFLETCRCWYNQCLEERVRAWEERRESISLRKQFKRIADLRKENRYAARLPVGCLRVPVVDLDEAFAAFFRRVKETPDKAPGHPKFRQRGRFRSFGYTSYRDGWRLEKGRLWLMNIGYIKVRMHREMDCRPSSLRLRVVKRCGKWYACLSAECAERVLPETGSEVGIDVGICSYITTSDGEKIENPKWFRQEEARLAVLQRSAARKKLHGSNRQKVDKQIARQHERIANRRKDFINKLVDDIIRRYDRIALEKLKVRNMLKNRPLAKSIADASWSYFAERIVQKAAEHGRTVCFVEAAYTSRTCSRCGRVREDLKLSDRRFDCECGSSMDRDHNAAVNILNRAGLARWGVT